MKTNSPMAQQIVDILEVLKKGIESLTLEELQLVEGKMTVELREHIGELIFKKQVNRTFKGYAVDPILPDDFFGTANDERPDSHRFWVKRPYIVTVEGADPVFFTVECLDGGAWDRPTYWGSAATLAAAAEICSTGPTWTKQS